MRVTLDADVYDALLVVARREFRRPEAQASYLLTRAINDLTRGGAADAA